MDIPERFHIMLYLVFIVPYVYFNLKLTHELLLWVPGGLKRVLMLLALWLLPIVGAVVAYRRLELDWFDSEKNKKGAQKNKNAGGQTLASGAMLEVDSMFNPGQRHVIEAKQKEHVEECESGEMHEKNFLEIESGEK